MTKICCLAVLLVSPAWCADSPLLFNRIYGGSGVESVSAMAVDPAGYVIIAGSTSSYDFPVSKGSINPATQFAASTDGGLTFRPVGNLPAGVPTSLAIDNTSRPAAWYASSTAGIFKSIDGGATWTATGAGPANFVAIGGNPAVVYATVGPGIVKSTDGGATWIAAARPAPDNPNPLTYLVVDPFHPDHIFTGIPPRQHMRSFDGGATWTPYTPPLIHPDSFCGTGVAPLAFDPFTPDLVYLQNNCDLFRSTDGGVYWNQLVTPFQISYAVVANPGRKGRIYALAFDGMYASEDGGASWKLLLAYPQGSPVYPVAADPAHPDTIVAGGYRSVDNGATWQRAGLGRNAMRYLFDAGRLVAVTEGGSTGFLARLNSKGDILAATYFGGQGSVRISGAATDPAGNIYLAGVTGSPDFPVTTPGVGAGSLTAAQSWFVASLDRDLALRYATYVPAANFIAVDRDGNAVVAGSALGPAACVVTKLRPDGAAVFQSSFGGPRDYCNAVAVDGAGSTTVAGQSFVKDPEGDVLLARFDPTGRQQSLTYFGGSDRDSPAAVAFDSSGNLYIAGTTASKDFPVTSGAYQATLSAQCAYPSSAIATGFIGTIFSYRMDDVFVTKMDPAGNTVFSTYLGAGCYDVTTGLSVDRAGNIWIAGQTDSSPFPQKMPFQSGPAWAQYKGFVTELDAGGGMLRLSSYIDAGATPVIAVDPFGNAWIGGGTAQPQSVYSGPPAPPQPVTGVHASVAKVQPQFPSQVAIQSVGNTFTLRNGPVSPGQITLIQAEGVAPANPADMGFTPAAPLPRALADTQVLFDGEAAPLISVAQGRVVALAPYDLAGRRQVTIQVVFQGTLSAPYLADIQADPGYRSMDGSGSGQAFAVNQDGTINSPQNPAPEGSYITVYLTGVGSVNPSCPEGGIAPDGFPMLSATPVPVPGAICGLFQQSFRTPDHGPAGNVTVPASAVTYAVQ